MSEGLKQCFRCGHTKPLDEFYRHKMMGDKHLNKCKACTRADVEERRQRLEATDPNWVENEAARHREKSRRYRAAGRAKVQPAKMRAARKRWEGEHPHQKRANQAVNNAVRDGRLQKRPCERCGNPTSEGHHEDYSKPLDVIWLCRTHHAERHVEINRERRAARFASRSE